ncbi:hypothetical protein ACQPZA_05920 [Pseudonocardia xinjiangensis]|uniref:hypothetical protein n=1 Tax=Pseudonocardia xinjiangensis TaxID=75289 RepID=UPI003D91DDA0
MPESPPPTPAGSSTGPDPDPVLESAARALAGLVQPDLTAFPEPRVWEAMTSVVGDGGQAGDGLGRLRARIHELSGAMTRLEDADMAEFGFRSKEFGAVYQRLVGLFTERLLIIGRGSPQFLFVPHRPTSDG